MEAIYAIDLNNGLSKNGIIPWNSKKDILFFMNKTKHNIVIMGKNTYFSLPEKNRPLKNRLNIVLTNDSELYNKNNNKNVIFTNNDSIYKDILINKNEYNNLYNFLDKDFKIFFIGGKIIYQQFIPLCNKIWVTQIKCNYNCDLFFKYDYSREFISELYDEDNEMKIIKYIRL